MFNLLIANNPDSWTEHIYVYQKSRVAIEYTADEISERYKNFEEDVIQELKTFPTLFVTELETSESRIGYITDIHIDNDAVIVSYEFDPVLPSLPRGTIQQLADAINLGRWELRRTHWAIKDGSLFDILVTAGYLTHQQVDASLRLQNPVEEEILSEPPETSGPQMSQVFIVHGHDGITKLDMADFIKSIGLEPIILDQQASAGKTIIEKIEHYSNVGFGVVLYTPCDIGHKADVLNRKYRARQNVVFEHGYLMAKLGRERVVAIVKGDVETPNDISGVIYIEKDDAGAWQNFLRTELRGQGYQV